MKRERAVGQGKREKQCAGVAAQTGACVPVSGCAQIGGKTIPTSASRGDSGINVPPDQTCCCRPHPLQTIDNVRGDTLIT